LGRIIFTDSIHFAMGVKEKKKKKMERSATHGWNRKDRQALNNLLTPWE